MPQPSLLWAVCKAAAARQLTKWSVSPAPVESGELMAAERGVSEALASGLSRAPRRDDGGAVVLGEFVSVVRGIATGANDFFCMTGKQTRELHIPKRWLRRAVGRTRDVEGEALTGEDLCRLEAAGRPTYLLSLGAEPMEALPAAVQMYLSQGEQAGLPQRALIGTRRPWYKMEVRTPPPILFAYLGRRSSRFVRNRAGVVPLTGFLCVYPRPEFGDKIEQLWKLVSHAGTIANLARVGKSYGGGAIKVEPRALERLPVPAAALKDAGLYVARRGRGQARLAFRSGA